MDFVFFNTWTSDKIQYLDIELYPYKHLMYDRNDSLIFKYTCRADKKLRTQRFLDAIRYYATLVCVVPMALHALEAKAGAKLSTVQDICYFIEDVILFHYQQFLTKF